MCGYIHVYVYLKQKFELYRIPFLKVLRETPSVVFPFGMNG